jgi:replicative DNA helicase
MSNLPCCLDAERSLIGAILLRPEVLDGLGVSAADFHHPAHLAAYAAALDLWTAREPVDLVTVSERAGSRVELAYLADLLALVATAENAAYYARLVRDASSRRRILSAAAQIAERARDSELTVAALVRESVAELEKCESAGPAAVGIDTVVERVWEEVQARRRGEGTDGVPTGIPALDERLTYVGLPRGQVTIAAGATSAGKSALALTAMLSAARAGLGVLCATLEDDPAAVVKRALARIANIDNRAMQRAVVSESELDRLTPAMTELAQHRVAFLDRAPARIEDFCAAIERHVKHHDTALVVVDFLQLLESGGRHQKRQDEVDAVFGAIVRSARRLPCATLVVSQLRRTEGRPPTKEDLYHSGALEQWAHTILLLWRPDLPQFSRLVALLVAKQKNGPTGRLVVGWDASLCCYRNAPASDADAFERALDGMAKRGER